MSKVLTVVVPSYNTEQYMDECIPTFLADEILDDIEILLIDDGSKDGTAKKGLEYEKQYPGTIKLVSKENGGHGSTINKGIELATGKYFKVVDGDDWVDTEAFRKLVLYLKETDCDIIACQFCRVKHDTKAKEERNVFGIVFNRIYTFDEACGKVDRIEMHAMTIKTSILRDNHIHIDEHMYYVDVEYILFPIPFVDTIVFLKDHLYMYRVFSDTQSMSINNLRKNVQQHYDVLFHLIHFFGEVKESISTTKRNYIIRSISMKADMHYNIRLSFLPSNKAKRELIVFDTKLKDSCKEIYNNNRNRKVPMLRKTRFVLYPIMAIFMRTKLYLRLKTKSANH